MWWFNVEILLQTRPMTYMNLWPVPSKLFCKSFHNCCMYFRDPKHSPGGELLLGGTDPNYYTGNFNYLETREMGKWEVTIKGYDICWKSFAICVYLRIPFCAKIQKCQQACFVCSGFLWGRRWCFVKRAAQLWSTQAPPTSQAQPPLSLCWWKLLVLSWTKLEYVHDKKKKLPTKSHNLFKKIIFTCFNPIQCVV